MAKYVIKTYSGTLDSHDLIKRKVLFSISLSQTNLLHSELDDFSDLCLYHSLGGVAYTRVEEPDYETHRRACEMEAAEKGRGCLFRLGLPFY